MLEILKLKQMLEEANIPFTWNDDVFGWKDRPEAFKRINPELANAYQIVVYSKSNCRLCDAIHNSTSYGNKEGLLEIMGGLTEEENEDTEVLGWLTAEEVFKRFKYCYENNTSVYVEDK